MGATNINHVIKGKATRTDIDKAFRQRQDNDRSENGHQEGYSGDFQTVRSVDYQLHKEFESFKEAEEFCLDQAEKWETVVAVYFKRNGEVNTLLAGWGAE